MVGIAGCVGTEAVAVPKSEDMVQPSLVAGMSCNTDSARSGPVSGESRNIGLGLGMGRGWLGPVAGKSHNMGMGLGSGW
jgi:hypothetical protein